MKRFLFVVLCLTAIMAPAAARAELSIAVVDVQALLTQSDAAKDIEKQVNQNKEKFLAGLSQQEKTLREEEKKLSDERASLSKEEFAKKAKAFEEKLIATRRDAQEQKRAFDIASGKALGKLRDKLIEVSEEIAKEKSYSLVISKQNVIVGESSMDITEETMRRLNLAVKTIPLEITKK